MRPKKKSAKKKPVKKRKPKRIAPRPKLVARLDATEEKDTAAIAAKRGRRKGGGAKRKLTPQQIDEGKRQFRRELMDHPEYRHKVDQAADDMLTLLKYNVSSYTIKRYIVWPVLNELVARLNATEASDTAAIAAKRGSSAKAK